MNEQSKHVESVEELIARRKLNKRKIIIQKWTRRLIGTLVIIGITLLTFIFLGSNESKVKAIIVSGNRILTQEDLIKKSNLGYNEIYLMQFAAIIEKRLKTETLISDARVEMLRGNTISIKITEKKVLALHILAANALVLADGSQVPMQTQFNSAITQKPILFGFEDNESLKLFADAFKGISESAMMNVSEIHQESTSYDKMHIKIVMQDGNKIYSSLKTVSLLEDYPKILNQLKVTNSCITFDEMTKTAFSQVCIE